MDLVGRADVAAATHPSVSDRYAHGSCFMSSLFSLRSIVKFSLISGVEAHD